MKSRKFVYFIVPSLNNVGGVEDLVSRFSEILVVRHEMRIITFDKNLSDNFFDINCEINPIGNNYWTPIKYFFIFFNLLRSKNKVDPQSCIFISILPIADILNGATKFFSKSRCWSLWVINIKGNSDNRVVFQFRKIFGIFYRRFDKIFCIDEYLLKEPSVIFNFKPDKIKLFYNFISSIHFQCHLSKTNAVRSPFTILFCARLEPIKNPLSVIKVAARLKNLDVSVRFLVVGTGSLKESMINCARSNGLSVSFGQSELCSDVVFVPVQRDLTELYSISDLCILPSLSEGFPTIIGSGLARGIPIIVSKVFGGLNRVRGSSMHEEFGFSFFRIGAFGPVPLSALDYEAWAKAICFMMDNRNLFSAVDCRECMTGWSATEAEGFWHQELTGEPSNP